MVNLNQVLKVSALLLLFAVNSCFSCSCLIVPPFAVELRRARPDVLRPQVPPHPGPGGGGEALPRVPGAVPGGHPARPHLQP